MKCPHCHALCAPGDTICFTCHQPIAGRVTAAATAAADPQRAKRDPAQIMATLFMALGVGIYAPAYSQLNAAKSGRGIDLNNVLGAGAVGCVCGTVGYAIGALFRRR
jgi:hypothetical protein